ncbi:hypothetical protein [Nocardia suismassiliense]|uniref:hypothetical protein n=1 Tax=Nocardia suismassiliense TaxID=2077092 RepID=UPI00131EF197|nr:hypothetical protein [Nocardia suismassiliense]
MADLATTRVRKATARRQAKNLPRPDREEVEQLQHVDAGGMLPDYYPTQRMYLDRIGGFRSDWLPGGPKKLAELAVGGPDGLIAAVTDAKARLRAARRDGQADAGRAERGHLLALKAEFTRRDRPGNDLSVLERAHIEAARYDVLYNRSDESPSHWAYDDLEPESPAELLPASPIAELDAAAEAGAGM